MYTIEIKLTNPVIPTIRELKFQFDPETWTEADWTGAWPIIAQEISAIRSIAAISEPPIWKSSNTKFSDAVAAATPTLEAPAI